MTTNWFSNFYSMTQNAPANNLIEKAAFAEFGKAWFFQNKVAERIASGKKLYEKLCNGKEVGEMYSDLLDGVTDAALAKEAGFFNLPELGLLPEASRVF